MKPALAIRTTSTQVSRYQDLLVERWNESTLERAVTLALEVAGLKSVPRTRATTRSRTTFKPLQIPQGASEQLRAFLEMSNARLPRVPEELPETPTTMKRRAATGRARILAECLALELYFEMSGDTGLLRDIRSIAWQCGLEFLLPDLKDLGLQEEHDLLVNAMGWHAAAVWQDVPTHSNWMLAGLHASLANTEASDAHFEAALSLLPPDAHEYLTIAQAYWHHLLDTRRQQQAQEFLFRLHRRVPEASAAEVERLILLGRRRSIA